MRLVSFNSCSWYLSYWWMWSRYLSQKESYLEVLSNGCSGAIGLNFKTKTFIDWAHLFEKYHKNCLVDDRAILVTSTIALSDHLYSAKTVPSDDQGTTRSVLSSVWRTGLNQKVQHNLTQNNHSVCNIRQIKSYDIQFQIQCRDWPSP